MLNSKSLVSLMVSEAETTCTKPEDIPLAGDKEFLEKKTSVSCSASDAHKLERPLPLWYAVCTLLFFCSLRLT